MLGIKANPNGTVSVETYPYVFKHSVDAKKFLHLLMMGECTYGMPPYDSSVDAAYEFLDYLLKKGVAAGHCLNCDGKNPFDDMDVPPKKKFILPTPILDYQTQFIEPPSPADPPLFSKYAEYLEKLKDSAKLYKHVKAMDAHNNNGMDSIGVCEDGKCHYKGNVYPTYEHAVLAMKQFKHFGKPFSKNEMDAIVGIFDMAKMDDGIAKHVQAKLRKIAKEQSVEHVQISMTISKLFVKPLQEPRSAWGKRMKKKITELSC